jgi:hypothetical protein
LKVAEAIAHGRALVTCPYGAASLTAAQRRAAVVEAEPERQAAAIVRLLDDADERNQRGLSLYDEATTWVQALAPLTALLVDRFGTVSRAGGR